MAQLPPYEPLTARESRVLDLLREGLSNKQIGRAICISEQTVKYHLKNLYLKLGAQGRAHAVALSGEARSEPRPEPAERAEHDRAQIDIPQSPLALVQRTRRLHGAREAVVDGEQRWTYAQFFDRCERWALALQHLGVGRGDRVAVIAPNTHGLLEQFYAVPMIGAIIVPLPQGLTPDDYGQLIRHSGAKLVCASREYLAQVQALCAQLDSVAACVALDAEAPQGWIDYEEQIARVECGEPFARVDEQAVLSINYTSGTTRTPRGAMLTHRNLWTNSVGVLMHWPVRAEDRYLWLLPMFHCNGWGFVWTISAAGAMHVCSRSADPVELAALIVRERVSMLCAGRSALIGIANASEPVRRHLPRGVRVMTAGATPAAATIERVESRLGWEVTHVYGLSETSPFLSINEMPMNCARLSVSERARLKTRQGTELLTSGELRVVDEEGQDVPRDGSTLGEIVVRGGVVMKGYYRDPDATARAFAGGWFHTGDAAVMHADGSVEIRDRFKDLIVSGDALISSIEVEDVLLGHAAVREAAVVGQPHAELGESAWAYVVVHEGMTVTQAELQAFVARQLAAFKVPSAVRCLPRLPRTSTGKVIKQQLRSYSAG